VISARGILFIFLLVLFFLKDEAMAETGGMFSLLFPMDIVEEDDKSLSTTIKMKWVI